MSDLIDSLSRDLRGYWCPMLQYGGLTLRDQTRFKNNGTLTNMDVSTDWVMSRVRGRSGRVLDFDGTNDRVPVSSSVSLNPASALSLAAWFRVASVPAGVQQVIVRKGWTTGTNLQYSIRVLGDKVGGFVVNSSGTLATATGATSIAANTWYFGVCSYDGANVRVYLDAILDATTALTGAVANFTQPFSIGSAFDTSLSTPTLFFGGQIAELAIWDRALNPGEIQELYRLGPGWFQPQLPRRIPYSEQQAGFRAYWARRQLQLIGGGV